MNIPEHYQLSPTVLGLTRREVNEGHPVQVSSSVGVSIVNFHCAPHSVAFVESLLRVIGGSTLHIACVDNSENECEVAALREAFGRLLCPSTVRIDVLVSPENVGYARAHNLATTFLMESGVDVVVIVNPDVRVDSGQLDGLAEQVRQNPHTIYGVRTSEKGHEYSGFSALNGWTSKSRKIAEWNSSQGFRFPNGHFLATSREAWARLGGFDARYFLYYEEPDLTIRAASCGITVGQLSDWSVTHEGGLTTRDASRNKSRITVQHSIRSALLFTRLHYPTRLPLVVASRLLYGLRWILADPGMIGYVSGGFAGGLTARKTKDRA